MRVYQNKYTPSSFVSEVKVQKIGHGSRLSHNSRQVQLYCTPIKVYRQNINAQQYTVNMTPWSNFGWGFMIKFPPRRWSVLLFNHDKQSSSKSWRVWHSHSLTKL